MTTTKFKYNDKVRIIGTDICGELIDIVPTGIFNNIKLYKYVMFTCNKGNLLVDESQLEIHN